MKKKNICSKNNTSISLKSVNKEENKKNINSLLEKKKEKILKSNILNKKNILRIKKKDSKNLESKKKRKKKNFNQLTNNYKENTNINKNKKNIKNNKKKKIFISKNSEKRFFSNKKRISKTKIYNSKLQQKFVKPSKILNKKIIIGDFISVVNLSKKMAIKSSKVIKNLLNLGISATSEKILDQDTAQLVSEDMGYQVFLHQENMLEVSLMKNRNLNISKKKKRPPIVTIMGHVDHGKTSLLDYIRSSKIASKEKGGITQHIGAYHVNTKKGTITFLDTPGHSAFTAMRARGTNVTDIVVLVVAADDGVMPQTIEAIQHAQNAKVPIIVAINKIDKTKNNLEIIKKELIKYSIIPEEFGGENIFVLVSAKTGFGIDNLLSNILLQAEILELKSSYTSMAEGIVIESYLDKQCGPVATIIISEGILHINDIVICGLEYGKIKLLKNEYDKDVLSASPSIPIKVFGLSGVPNTGDLFTVVNNEKKARAVSIYRRKKLRELKFSNQKKTTIDHLFDNINIKNQSSINIILKTDFQGSLEAILDSLKLLSDKSIKINIIMSGVGAITETDVSLSMTTTSILIGFNIRADFSARKIIELENLDIRYYSIIHDLINDIKNIKLGLLTPKNKNKIIGLAEVRNIFKSPKFGLIAGCMVIEGIIKKNNPIRILRNNIVIYEGELESLRHFKEDVLEVRCGMECGIGIKNYNDIKISDIIELFQIIK